MGLILATLPLKNNLYLRMQQNQLYWDLNQYVLLKVLLWRAVLNGRHRLTPRDTVCSAANYKTLQKKKEPLSRFTSSFCAAANWNLNGSAKSSAIVKHLSPLTHLSRPRRCSPFRVIWSPSLPIPSSHTSSCHMTFEAWEDKKKEKSQVLSLWCRESICFVHRYKDFLLQLFFKKVCFILF